MTIFTDSAAVGTVTTPSSSDIAAFVDASSIKSTTTPSGVDVLYQDVNTVGSVTTPNATTEIAQYVDAATIETRTRLEGSYLMETFTIHTTDYDKNPWSIAYSFDGSIPTVGCVGMFDDDQGLIS